MEQFMEVHLCNSIYSLFSYVANVLDDFPEDETFNRISLPLFVSYTILSSFGVIFACVCLWFNLWFRNQK